MCFLWPTMYVKLLIYQYEIVQLESSDSYFPPWIKWDCSRGFYQLLFDPSNTKVTDLTRNRTRTTLIKSSIRNRLLTLCLKIILISWGVPLKSFLHFNLPRDREIWRFHGIFWTSWSIKNKPPKKHERIIIPVICDLVPHICVSLLPGGDRIYFTRRQLSVTICTLEPPSRLNMVVLSSETVTPKLPEEI